jgi:hypothetical protein
MPLDAHLITDIVIGGLCLALSLYLTYGLFLAVIGGENGVMRSSSITFVALALLGLWLVLTSFLPTYVISLWKTINFMILLLAEAFLIYSLKKGNR